jgi:hypothetical protein
MEKKNRIADLNNMTGKEFNYIRKRYGYTVTQLARIAESISLLKEPIITINKIKYWINKKYVPSIAIELLYESMLPETFLYLRDQWRTNPNFYKRTKRKIKKS